jgi:hypothetical protein
MARETSISLLAPVAEEKRRAVSPEKTGYSIVCVDIRTRSAPGARRKNSSFVASRPPSRVSPSRSRAALSTSAALPGRSTT